MISARTSAAEAARERRRQKGESQAVPIPVPAAAAAAAVPEEAEQNEELPFDEMIKRELDHAMDLEIKQALNKVKKRMTALMAQESSLVDVIKDDLGHDSDFYEDLVYAVQAKDPRIGESKEQIYEYLNDLKFTEMRSLDALHEMYPVSEEHGIEQQQEQEQQQQQQQQEKVQTGTLEQEKEEKQG